MSCICHRLCSFLEVWLPHNSTYQYSTERPFYSQKCHTGLLFPLSYVHHFAFNQNPILRYFVAMDHYLTEFIILRSIRIQSYSSSIVQFLVP
ncbi:hypothetical protein HMPREF1246_0609 [Acidaminococcus sp. BV3L6]|nr:hypothetical protein HMPREF1246_0609 [Acidaminococcus sp. BV3L6]